MNKNDIIPAELALIGSMFVDPKQAIPMMVNTIEPKCFSNPLLGEAYRIGLQMYAESGVVDFLPHIHILEQTYNEDDCKILLAQSIQIFGDILNLPQYIKAVKNHYKARRLSEICSKHSFITPGENEIDSELEAVGAQIAELLNDNKARGLKSSEDIALEQYKNLFNKDEIRGSVRTGLYGLDSIIKRFRRKQFIILAARPGIGKSAMALNWSIEFARQGKRVGFFSPEMSEEELYERYISNMSPMNMGVIQNRDFGNDSLIKINSASSEFSKLPIYINDYGGQTVQSIRTEAQLKKIDVVIVDYLQILMPPYNRNYNRTNEVGQMSRELKQMAMDLDIPVIALSQLNRNKDGSDEPSLASLRESGSIEQDANIIIFLWENEPKGDKQYVHLACKVAKSRNGRTGEVVLKYTGGVMGFEETSLKVNRNKKESGGYKLKPWQDMGDMEVFT